MVLNDVGLFPPLCHPRRRTQRPFSNTRIPRTHNICTSMWKFHVYSGARPRLFREYLETSWPREWTWQAVLRGLTSSFQWLRKDELLCFLILWVCPETGVCVCVCVCGFFPSFPPLCDWVTSARGARPGPIQSKLHFLMLWCYFHFLISFFFLIAACLEPLNVILKQYF